jgi:hypothetical protein
MIHRLLPIKCAALRCHGKIYTGETHRECINQAIYAGATREHIEKAVQGFVDTDNVFYDRAESGRRAIDCGQIKTMAHPPELNSSDLLLTFPNNRV